MGSPALLQHPVYMPGMYLVSKYMATPRGMDTAKENTVGFVDRRRDAGFPDLLLVAVRPYYPVCGAVRNTACPGLHPISYSVCSVYAGAFVRTKKI